MAFLSERIGGNHDTPNSTLTNQRLSARSAMLADVAEGMLSGYRMVVTLPTDQRQPGSMRACLGGCESAQDTPSLSWSSTTPAFLQQRKAVSDPPLSAPTRPAASAVQGLR